MSVKTVLAAGLLAAGSLTGTLATPATAATPHCASADLAVRYHVDGAAMGSTYGYLVLTNRTRRACVTGGFGGLSYVGHGDGTQIGAAAVREPSRVRAIVLQPGQRVRSRVQEVTALNYPRSRCHPVRVDGFRVYVPNSTRSQYVVHPTVGCANPRVHLLSHRAFRRP
jgi:hypothetical protein